jgi:hypothetical protein
LAATRSSSGIEILYWHCPGDSVQSVELLSQRGSVIGDDDPVLWQIRAHDASSARSFVIGMTPEGFLEIVPLAVEIAPTDRLSVLVEATGAAGVGLVFEPAKLNPHTVLLRSGEQLSREEFRTQALRGCS